MLQDEGGASRDEIAAALVEVSEGRVPKDRIALRELYREIMDWPFVEKAPEEEEDGAAPSSSSPYEAITPTGVEGSHPSPCLQLSVCYFIDSYCTHSLRFHRAIQSNWLPQRCIRFRRHVMMLIGHSITADKQPDICLPICILQSMTDAISSFRR